MIYLDHAATTPIDPRVLEAMLPHMRDAWGNPSSPHRKGREARSAIDHSRQTMADLLGVRPHEVIFVSSGSEGNSLALFGVAEARLDARGKPGHIVSLQIEHECSLKAIERLEKMGWQITLLPVDREGMADPRNFEKALTEDTALVSIQWANNEVGTIQPIEEVAAICRERRIPFHCDAVQPVGILPLPPVASPGTKGGLPDLLTIAAHKFYGPKGVGALVVREGTPIQPLIMGGGQEFGLRAGTENTSGIVGMAAALEIAVSEQKDAFTKLKELNTFFVQEIERLPGTSLNGHLEKRLPSIANIRFADRSGENLVIQLDLAGICAATGSACATGAAEPSHVLQAMGRNKLQAGENLRFSFGKGTTEEELRTTAQTLRNILSKS